MDTSLADAFGKMGLENRLYEHHVRDGWVHLGGHYIRASELVSRELALPSYMAHTVFPHRMHPDDPIWMTRAQYDQALALAELHRRS